MLRLLKCVEEDEEHGGQMRAVQHYSLADNFDRETLLAMTGACPAVGVQTSLPFTAGAAQKKHAAPPPPPRWTGAGLTPRQRLDGARGAGARFDLWSDGTGFTPNLDFVDAAFRNTLLDMIRDNHDALLAELRREAGHAAH
jgi:hypothetical protein